MTEGELINHTRRIHHHMYETCEGISEHAERIVKLEEVAEGIRDITLTMCGTTDCECCAVTGEGNECRLYVLDAALDRLLAE